MTHLMPTVPSSVAMMGAAFPLVVSPLVGYGVSRLVSHLGKDYFRGKHAREQQQTSDQRIATLANRCGCAAGILTTFATFCYFVSLMNPARGLHLNQHIAPAFAQAVH